MYQTNKLFLIFVFIKFSRNEWWGYPICDIKKIQDIKESEFSSTYKRVKPLNVSWTHEDGMRLRYSNQVLKKTKQKHLQSFFDEVLVRA